MAQIPKHSTLGRPVNEKARALRREQILVGARMCVLRKGFHAATTAEISAMAKVSVANLYQYFPTKDDLVRALIDADLTSDLELLRIIEAAGSFREGLGMATRLVAEGGDVEQESRLRLEILAEASRNPAVAAVVKAADNRLVGALGELISRYQGRGELSDEFAPTIAARMLISLYDGLLGRLAFGLDDTEQLLAAVDRFVLQALAPAPAVDRPAP
jgi:TetR/AcrR family transcriptional repressor of uid operon